MYDGAGEDEEVPDHVEAFLVDHVEYDAGGVEDTAHDEKEEAAAVHEGVDGLSEEDHAPAHDYVEPEGCHLPFLQVDRVQGDAGYGAGCVQAKQHPAAHAADQ